MKYNVLAAAVVLAAGVTVLPAYAATDSSLQSQLEQLKTQQSQLEKQVSVLEGESASSSFISTGKIGGNFLANGVYQGRDLSLLKELAQAGEDVAPLNVGGIFEIDAYGGHNTDTSPLGSINSTENALMGLETGVYSDGKNISSMWLDTVRLDFLTHVNTWINVETRVDYSNTSIGLTSGSIIIGNLERSPLYMDVGSEYVPFGQFDSNIVYSNNLAKFYFRPNNFDQVTAGFYKNGLNTTLTGFQSADAADINNSSGSLKSWSTQVNYTAPLGEKLKNKVGAGYISNISGASDYLVNYTSSTSAAVTAAGHRKLPAWNVSDDLTYGPWTLSGDFASTLYDVSRDSSVGSDAKLMAYDAELDYSFVYHKPVTLALNYSSTIHFDGASVGNYSGSIDVGAFKNMWLASAQVELYDGVYLGAELDYAEQYLGTDTSSTGSMAAGLIDFLIQF